MANDEIANFYFGEDGIVKTGKQAIYNEETGETENWFSTPTVTRKGRATTVSATHPLRLRKRQDATADQRYAPADLNGVTYLVGTTGKRAESIRFLHFLRETGAGTRI